MLLSAARCNPTKNQGKVSDYRISVVRVTGTSRPDTLVRSGNGTLKTVTYCGITLIPTRAGAPRLRNQHLRYNADARS